MTSCFSNALGIASGFYVGKCIGEKDVRAVKTHLRAAIALSLLVSTAIALFCFACKKPIIRMFTKHEEVTELLLDSFNVLIAYRWFLAVYNVCDTCARAAGLQVYQFVCGWISFVLLFLPLTYVIVYVVEMDFTASWLGLIVYTLVILIFLQGLFFVWTDWDKLVIEAEKKRDILKLQQKERDEREGEDD